MTARPTGDGAPGLTVRGLTVADGNRPIVSELDLDLGPGRRLGVTGPSSSDVTAVLAGLAGLRRPPAGSVTVGGRPVGHDPDPDLVGYLSQDHRLIGTLTATENLLVTMLAGGVRPDRAAFERAEVQLRTLGLAPATWHNLVEQLSGGQQQRVALGRALVLRPRLLVLDHPTSELDPDTVELVDQVLRDAAHDDVCCVVSSDDALVLAGCDARLEL